MMDGANLPYTREEMAAFQRLKDDFEFYAPRCLKIRTKSGSVLAFTLNEAQRLIHSKIEEQRAKIGRVRALVLKGRQQGCSTYVEGRYYWRVTHGKGLYAFILTHEQDATDKLFEMANRYHEHCPPEIRPETGAASAKELHFPVLDSGYSVGTAGSKAVGRSATYQLFHGSEVGFWPNADTHAMGAMQTVPELDGTEIILESTANGIGNYFHKQWRAAERGESDFIAIFVPWFMTPEYRRPVDPGFKLTSDEEEYRNLYRVDLEQMAWRRAKITSFGGDEWRFKQEYPATAAEAFQTSGDDSFIPPRLVEVARKATAGASGALVVGVDPARFGDDRTSIIRRRGRLAFKLERYVKKDTMEVAGIVARIINEEKPRRVFIDVGGLGAGIIDRLRELGYRDVVEAVNFGGKPIAPERPEGGGFLNRRAEMWSEMKSWLDEQPAQIPDEDSLQADLCGPQYGFDSNQRLKLERKEDMKKRGLPSPDDGDALALTFAAPVVDSSWSRPLEYKFAKSIV